MPSPPPAAFVRYASWRRAFSALAAALGIKVDGGDIADLPGGGGQVFRFRGSISSVLPFAASGGSGSVTLEAGVLFYGGKAFYFPRARRSASGAYTVGISIVANVVLVNNGLGNPWSISTDTVSVDPPVIEVRTLGDMGTNMELRDTNWGIGSETVTVSTGVVFWPLASFDGDRLLQHWTGHLFIEPLENGQFFAGNGLYPTE